MSEELNYKSKIDQLREQNLLKWSVQSSRCLSSIITAMLPNPFVGHSQRENRHRAVRWFTSQIEHASNTEPQVTVSVPVDSNNHWYGVLGMSIPVRTMQHSL